MDNNSALLFGEDQAIFVSETQQEPPGAPEFLATDAARVLQVWQVLRRFDVADTPTEDRNHLCREFRGSLVVGIQSL